MYLFSGSKVIAEYQNGAAPSAPTTEYVYAGGALVAKVNSSGTFYYHQDHLSNRMVTNSSGGVYAEMGHFPFGEAWYNATSDKLYFTTYEYDAESGNHYAMARYHVSRLGRLSSPDPLSGSATDPQSLNRYSYSINDPANVTDPSGALPGCPYTVEAKPADKSQQASGKGPSDTDDSDADPPPQSGCGYGDPSDGGSVSLDGGDDTDFTGGVFGTGFTPGASTPGGSGVSTEIVVTTEGWETGAPGPLGYGVLAGDFTTIFEMDALNPGGLAPLSPNDQQRYQKLKSEALNDLINPDCISFLESVGINPVGLTITLLGQQAYNGSKSTITQTEAGVGITAPDATVAAGFNQPGVEAAASIYNNDVYFRQGGLLSGAIGNRNIQESIIEHEGLHNYLHIGDSALQTMLGVPVTASDTTDINQALKDHHCTH